MSMASSIRIFKNKAGGWRQHTGSRPESSLFAFLKKAVYRLLHVSFGYIQSNGKAEHTYSQDILELSAYFYMTA